MDKFIISDFVKFIINRNIPIIDVMLAYYQEIYHQQASSPSHGPSVSDFSPVSETSETPVAEAEAETETSAKEADDSTIYPITLSKLKDFTYPIDKQPAEPITASSADEEAALRNKPGYADLFYSGPFSVSEYNLKLETGFTILEHLESLGWKKSVYQKRRNRGYNINDALTRPLQQRRYAKDYLSFSIGQLSRIMKMNFKQIQDLIHEGSFPGPDVDNKKWSLKKLQTIPEFLKNYRKGE